MIITSLVRWPNSLYHYSRQTRNPSRSNARFKLSCPFKVLNYKMDFDVYEQLKLAEF
jgi:hypothetical protein